MIKPSYLFLIIFFLGFIALGYMHEAVHQEIFESYGISSQINWFRDFPDITTSTTSDPSACVDECILAHNVNEAIGYPLFVFYAVIGIGIWVLIVVFDEISISILGGQDEEEN